MASANADHRHLPSSPRETSHRILWIGSSLGHLSPDKLPLSKYQFYCLWVSTNSEPILTVRLPLGTNLFPTACLWPIFVSSLPPFSTHHTHTHSLSHSLTLSLTLSHSLSHTHTHTYTFMTFPIFQYLQVTLAALHWYQLGESWIVGSPIPS
jgi:hypothetical protein